MTNATDRPPALPRWANTALRLAVFALPAGFLGFPLLLMAWVRSPLITGVGEAVAQPIQFDHRHHVLDQGIPCTYCHDEATRSANAGFPPTEVCAGCHAQVWRNADRLAPVRDSALLGEPLRWRQVLDLPDFVYFAHAPHLAAAVSCSECHGEVEDMPMVVRARAFTMAQCLACHRDDRWDAVAGVSPPTYCTGCHR
ncbi:MAG: cytochrome c3 family protein [Myxococcota bacterium]